MTRMGAALVAWMLLGFCCADLDGAEQEKTKEEKNAVAWGKAVKGLQAGLRFSTPKSKYAVGEVVPLELVGRNTSDEGIVFLEPSAFLGAVEGKNELVLRPVGTGKRSETTTKLAPGKETVFVISLLLLSPGQTASPARPWVEITSGTYRSCAVTGPMIAKSLRGSWN